MTYFCNSCGKAIKFGEEYVRTTADAYHLECENALQRSVPWVVVSLIESELWRLKEICGLSLDIKHFF